MTGSGSALVDAGALFFLSSFSQNVTFSGATGILELAQSTAFRASLTGFSKYGGTSLDLFDVAFTGAGEASFSGTKTSGVLTVSDGTHTARITLIGDYRNVVFVASSTGGDGVIIAASGAAITASKPPAPPLHTLVAAMAGLGAGSAAGAQAWTPERAESWRPAFLAAGRAHWA